MSSAESSVCSEIDPVSKEITTHGDKKIALWDRVSRLRSLNLKGPCVLPHVCVCIERSAYLPYLPVSYCLLLNKTAYSTSILNFFRMALVLDHVTMSGLLCVCVCGVWLGGWISMWWDVPPSPVPQLQHR